jgi:hypothetical protein
MMGYPYPLLGTGLGSADVHEAIDLAAVSADYLPTELFS